MTSDPVFYKFLETFVFPVLTWVVVLFAFNIQSRAKKPHPLTYKIIEELAVVGIFKAENIINIGLLEPEEDAHFSPIDILKIVRGGG